MNASPPRLLLTPGDPAGIGPDLAVTLAQSAPEGDEIIVAVCDPDLLAERAHTLALPLRLRTVASPAAASPRRPGELDVLPVALAAPAVPGRLDPRNAAYVLNCIRRATALTLSGTADALVTGPVHKGAINDAGYAFSGHTEFIAAACGAPTPVMMLLAGRLRVALATTHLPLRAVPDAIDEAGLSAVLAVLHADLRRHFGIAEPRILVCGLNPHAGEGGHLGREEVEVIAPVVERLRVQGMRLRGPLPADTLFTPHLLDEADAVLAMYHDQGLPVLKYAGFGQAVNLTLGLPIIRTSVDHGTALELAGSGRAESGSLRQALALAARLARRRAGA